MKNMILVLSIITLSLVDSYDEEGRCGRIYGDCSDNECCSRFGFCGIMDVHCHLSEGCQRQYGVCAYEDDHYDPTQILDTGSFSEDGKCGPDKGVCPEGECCSKNGECGTTDDHCLVTKGCKSLYGQCEDDGDSLDDSELPPEEIPENKGKNLSPDGRKMERNTKNEKIIWDYLNEKFGNKYATAGFMGYVYYRTKLSPTHLDDYCLRKVHMSEKTYTRKTDKGTYKDFVTDNCGYGLYNTGYQKYKEGLLDFAKSKKKSIGDVNIQIEFFWKTFSEELSNYNPELLEELQDIKSLQLATNLISTGFFTVPIKWPGITYIFKELLNNAAFYYNIYGK